MQNSNLGASPRNTSHYGGISAGASGDNLIQNTSIKDLNYGISGSNVSVNVGGFIGHIKNSGHVMIKNSYAYNNISSHIFGTEHNRVGGDLIGFIESSNARIENTYVHNDINASNESIGHYTIIGGFIGDTYNARENNINNSYAYNIRLRATPTDMNRLSAGMIGRASTSFGGNNTIINNSFVYTLSQTGYKMGGIEKQGNLFQSNNLKWYSKSTNTDRGGERVSIPELGINDFTQSFMLTIIENNYNYTTPDSVFTNPKVKYSNSSTNLPYQNDFDIK